ncbi:carboxylesterase [Salsuginibacillus halophilus]|uniref:Carboxylesterase n=1 Tax=Salsuginibacillus halophilus TaxID=517424 RepID=A0A2P8H9D5_9BACI|nr:alpha/beta hydrolase [Salsuginibacillus halophilus]PSL42779.1 carboxylesterase [Salsuginibacillus halophilus]
MKMIPPKPFTFEAGPRAVLLLHAFTGSSTDVRALGRYLQKQGYTTHAPIYEGHAVPPEELMKTGPDEWWQNVDRAYQHLINEGYDEIAVCGLSLGGLMSLRAGYTFPVKGIIPMCAPMKTNHNKERLYQGVLSYAKEYKQLEGKTESEVNEEMEAFQQLPLDTLDSVNELIEEVHENLDMVDAPVQVIQAGKDELIDPDSANVLYEALDIREKELKWFENSPHVITHGPDKNELHETIYQFLEQLDWEKGE